MILVLLQVMVGLRSSKQEITLNLKIFTVKERLQIYQTSEFKRKFTEIAKKYKTQDILNADDTGLLYKAVPTKSLVKDDFEYLIKRRKINFIIGLLARR